MASGRGLRTLALTAGLLMGLLGLTGAGLAAPTVYGPTGLMLVPTADVLGNGNFNFALHQWTDNSYLTFNTSMIDNLEFGVTAVSWRGGSDAMANVKFRLMPETKQGPALAVGVNDLTDSNGRDAYLVVTKNLSQVGFRGTIGLTSNGLVAGLSKELNPVSISKGGRGGAPSTTLMIELDDHSKLNVGVGIGLTPEFRANVYLYDLDTAVLGVAYQSRF